MTEGQWIVALTSAIASLCGVIAGLYQHNRYLSKRLTENAEGDAAATKALQTDHSAEKDRLQAAWRKDIARLHREHQERMDAVLTREQDVLAKTGDLLERVLDDQ